MESSAISHRFQWNNENELKKQLQHLFDNNLDYDCIIITAQGNRIQAHQMILSWSSDFFRKILNELPPLADPPTIYIPDIDTYTLNAILRFIYMGETNVASESLSSFLGFCDTLCIKGCITNGFITPSTGNGLKSNNDSSCKVETVTEKLYYSSESCSGEEYLEIEQAQAVNSEEDFTEQDYLEEYLEDDSMIDTKEESTLVDGEYDENQQVGEFISFEIEKTAEDKSNVSSKDGTKGIKGQRQGRNLSEQIDEALNEVNTGKTIHQLSVEYKLPRSTLYHRFRNNKHLKQNYRQERKSNLGNAVQAVLQERLSLKMASDRFKVPKTAIWREVRKNDQYQPSSKEFTAERQSAQQEILMGNSLTSISAKYGIPMTTLHRDKKKLSNEGKLPESFRVKDRTEKSEYSQRLEMALEKCRTGMSQYQAAKLYNIPKATMWRYANSLNKSSRKSKEKQQNTDST